MVEGGIKTLGVLTKTTKKKKKKRVHGVEPRQREAAAYRSKLDGACAIHETHGVVTARRCSQCGCGGVAQGRRHDVARYSVSDGDVARGAAGAAVSFDERAAFALTPAVAAVREVPGDGMVGKRPKRGKHEPRVEGDRDRRVVDCRARHG